MAATVVPRSSRRCGARRRARARAGGQRMNASPAITYATLAQVRTGARGRVADVICPVCSVTRTGASAQRKVLRTWAKESAIGFHCARCEVDGIALAGDNDNKIEI